MNISAQDLRKAADLQEQIESLESELSSLLGTAEPGLQRWVRKGMSAAGRARIAAAQRARWAKVKARGNSKHPTRRHMSAAAKAKLAKIARLRWKKAKAAGKATL